MIDIDIITVLVATFASCVVGGFWYSSLLFGELWKRELKTDSRKALQRKYSWIFTVLLSLGNAFFLALFLAFLGASSTLDGIYVAVGLWIGFIVPSFLYPMIWSKGSVRLFLIDSFFWFVNLVVMGAIIAA